MTIALVVIGGEAPPVAVAQQLPAAAVVIAADSGLDHARALGLRVDVLVGDLDSVSEAALHAAEAGGVRIERHDAAKDATDSELAIDAALAAGADHLVVVSGGGGRLDHLLAGLVGLADPRLAGVTVEAWIGEAHIGVVRAERSWSIDAEAGTLVSLLPIGGPAHGVRTSGLRYGLQGETLWPTAARGVSNEALGGPATVTLTDGVLLAIRPHALAAGAAGAAG